MDQNEFTGIFCEKPQSFAWFLGAGASRSSGLPTAMDIIWDLKRRYYCREENEEITRQEVQISAVRNRIQSYMLSKGFPDEWAPEEYTLYFEKIFGEDRERQRRYLKGILSEDKARLSVGNRVFGAFLASGLTRAAFTTNFDTIVENAVAEVSGNSLSAYHIEGSQNATSAMKNEEFPIYCKLHGDFRYASIKNLKGDLLSQNEGLAECLKIAGGRFGFVVAGYSGRDSSIMDLFGEVLRGKNPFPHGLYWLGIKGSPIPEVIDGLLREARAVGVVAEYVEIETYDAIMLRLWRSLPDKRPGLDQRVRKSQVSDVSIPLPNSGSFNPLVRLNALPVIDMPFVCHGLDFSSSKQWSEIKDVQRRSQGSLILTKGERVICWGRIADVQSQFQDAQKIETYDFSGHLRSLSEHWYLKGFLEEAISKALVNGKPLLARTMGSDSYVIANLHAKDKSSFWELENAVGSAPFGVIPGVTAPRDDFHKEAEDVSWAECVRVSLELKDERFWLLVEPDIWIWPTRARRLARDFLAMRRGDRYNKKYNAILDAWVRLVLGTSARNEVVTVSAFSGGGESENPSFSIGTRTAFSRMIKS